VIAHGFGAVSWREVLDDLRVRGLVDDAGRLRGAGSAGPTISARPDWARRDAARALWAEGREVGGRLAERHIRLRGVRRALSSDLRMHPGVAAAIYAGTGVRRPALLAAIRDLAGEVCAVEVTFLAPSGARARMRTPRRTIGVIPPGSAVRLDAPGARLLVAEGVLTALSASEHFGWPAWALLSTSRLRTWTAPAGVREVLIAADRGADGERSARLLARRLRGAGLMAVIRWPPPPAGDWNEAAQGDGGRL
jgi:putative DNA primase/helicase